MDDRILISGGFKNSTSTLSLTFKCEKTHKLITDVSLSDSIEIIIIPFRLNEEVYPSAFFQDIIIPEYDYSPFHEDNFLATYKDEIRKRKIEIINSTSIDKLLEHYKTINWDSYIHLNNKMRIDIINSSLKISINYDSKEIQTFDVMINNIPRKIISFNINQLNAKFDEIKRLIYNDETMNKIKLTNSNVGNTKWYSNKYKEFIKAINKF